MSISIKFYGVRGSFPCPYPDFMEYGGATTCIEITNDKGGRIIIDGGIGIRKLGKRLGKENVRKINLFFTHYHLDHISGVPSFLPFYNEETEINVYASRDALLNSLEEAFNAIFSPPIFPVGYKDVQAKVVLNNFEGFDEFEVDGFKVKPYPLIHPGGSCGYRISYDNKTVSIVLDTSHEEGSPDKNVLSLIKDADVVIYDANYTDEEFDEFKEYGHSTWQEGIRLVRLAKAKKYVISHLNSSKNDEIIKGIEIKAKTMYEDTLVAKENMEIII